MVALKTMTRAHLTIPLLLLVASCSSSPTYTVGGSTTGLRGEVVLQNSGGDTLSITANAPFSFTTAVANGAAYAVTVLTQPTDQACTVGNGTGAIDGADVTNVSVTCAYTTSATLTSSVPALTLSVKDTATNAALTGNPRQVTVTNTSSSTAHDVSFAIAAASDADPTITSNATPNTSCGDIAPSGSCVLTITPTSATASATPFATSSTPIELMVTGGNTDALAISITTLTYGSIFDGGFVFSIDDAYADYPIDGSIGGKVTTLTSQMLPRAPGVIWSSDASGAYDNGVSIWGIDASSTSAMPSPNGDSLTPDTATQYAGQLDCNGYTDGACNTNNIYVYYQSAATGAPVPLTDYAVGLCKQPIAGFSDWYLPAICEMGQVGLDMHCDTNPVEQNIGDALPSLLSSTCTGDSCLSGGYWSSTEQASTDGAGPQVGAWREGFKPDGGSSQSALRKDQPIGVRCVRAFP